MPDCPFEKRIHEDEEPRPGDARDSYSRDRARLIHSAAFRRLQGKTQVMGVGEGDFHRTRLTHSLECAQIGRGILATLKKNDSVPDPFKGWLPSDDLVEAACLAHDLGHPPFGHHGERALHKRMQSCGGFEGNAQTLRIISKLEKYRIKEGINPTKRLVLAILKYPSVYTNFKPEYFKDKPPKCYYESEEERIVFKAIDPFDEFDQKKFLETNEDGTSKFKTFDCSLMEIADDVAYGVHDWEDIIARKFLDKYEISEIFSKKILAEYDRIIWCKNIYIDANKIIQKLTGDAFERKKAVSELVNFFVSSVQYVKSDSEFKHPLLAYNAKLPEPLEKLL